MAHQVQARPRKIWLGRFDLNLPRATFVFFFLIEFLISRFKGHVATKGKFR